MSVTFDTFHFDTSGFADVAPLNIPYILVTFDVSHLDTSGFAFVAPANILVISVTFDVFSFSQPLISPLIFIKKYSERSGKYNPFGIKLIFFTLAFFQPPFPATAPNCFAMLHHLSFSICISPELFLARTSILSLLSISA